ncbi:MAG: glycosyltransferase family 4 protein [Prevotella ruminicola]|jgi:glycosyltransferase involved in cell wall biosynthesis|uniref:Glycosyltransferase family 4 protein n=1 Tax=Xylanibacter ruminicola TaxID=839 RepID=A0A9D5S9G4_XYLRU|nr:glycosyltransferase family 4 protein [Xylanibacter ruminicola]
MKKICFVVDSIFSIGGVQRVTAVIAKELAKNYDVSIVTFDKPEEKDTALYQLNEANIKYRFFAYPQVGRFKTYFCKTYSGLYLKLQPKAKWCSDLYAHSSYPSELKNALLEELKQGKYDVIIGVHAPLAARLATLKKDLPNTKLIGWLHNSFEALFGKDSHYYIGQKRKRHYVYQFRKLDEVVLLCNHDAINYYKFDPKFKPTIIYNPLTLIPGRVSSGTSKRFLAVGRFSHLHKGFDLLIKAFNIFAKKNLEWQLDIIGEGPEEDLYKELIQEYSLEKRITIHPFTNNIQSFYSNAQVYVLSSRWEGFGLVLVEAMAHGLPIVSSDLPTSKEIMGDFGMYFKNGNIEELAQRLEDATHIEWQEKSKTAIAIAQRFDIKNIITQWKQLIE